MYNERVTSPVVVRTPMGGGRGYGPTHSQNLEKHFVGVPGLTVLVLHQRARVPDLYQTLRRFNAPVLIIENKLLYRERCNSALPQSYEIFETSGKFPATLLRSEMGADITIVAFGRMGILAESVVARLAQEEEVLADLILPLQVWPFDSSLVLASVNRTSKLLVIEEGAAGFDLGGELIACAASAYQGEGRLHCRRIAALPMAIPSALELERQVLPCEQDIFDACLELFDE